MNEHKQVNLSILQLSPWVGNFMDSSRGLNVDSRAFAPGTLGQLCVLLCLSDFCSPHLL